MGYRIFSVSPGFFMQIDRYFDDINLFQSMMEDDVLRGEFLQTLLKMDIYLLVSPESKEEEIVPALFAYEDDPFIPVFTSEERLTVFLKRMGGIYGRRKVSAKSYFRTFCQIEFPEEVEFHPLFRVSVNPESPAFWEFDKIEMMHVLDFYGYRELDGIEISLMHYVREPDNDDIAQETYEAINSGFFFCFRRESLLNKALPGSDFYMEEDADGNLLIPLYSAESQIPHIESNFPFKLTTISGREAALIASSAGVGLVVNPLNVYYNLMFVADQIKEIFFPKAAPEYEVQGTRLHAPLNITIPVAADADGGEVSEDRLARLAREREQKMFADCARLCDLIKDAGGEMSVCRKKIREFLDRDYLASAAVYAQNVFSVLSQQFLENNSGDGEEWGLLHDRIDSLAKSLPHLTVIQDVAAFLQEGERNFSEGAFLWEIGDLKVFEAEEKKVYALRSPDFGDKFYRLFVYDKSGKLLWALDDFIRDVIHIGKKYDTDRTYITYQRHYDEWMFGREEPVETQEVCLETGEPILYRDW